MKRIIILVILLFLVTGLTALSVSYEQALKTAEHQISVHDKTEYSISDNFEIKDSNEITLAYVFNLQPKGYIATSTDTDVYPVIGYSFYNNFSDLDIPENIGYQYLKNDIKLRLEAIPVTSEEVKQSNRILWRNYLNGTYEQIHSRNNIYPPEGYSPTEGWIDTQWHQNEPYNNFCPLDPETEQRSKVGCGATAFAQILNYHKYIGDVSFDDSDDYVSAYTTPNIYIDDDFGLYDFPSFPELNPYLDELKIDYENYSVPDEEMITALNFASGIALQLYYSSTGTGLMAYSPLTYIQKFDYISSEKWYTSSPDFYTLLGEDMMECRPAYLRIGGASVGHLINCDGYNGNDNTYHLNMGWGGSSDGWYSLPEGMPAGYSILSWGGLNIEGGSIPFDVYGSVTVNGVPVENTNITLDGARFHEISINDPNGTFDIPILFPGEYEMTAISVLENGGYLYKHEVITLDEANNLLNIDLDDYSEITGSVSANINTENTHITVYQDEIPVSSGIADANGDYSIPGVIPGDYTATASLSGNYFDTQDVTISVNNQIIDFQLEEYPYEFTFNFAGDPVGQLQLFQFMSCAIRLSGEELIGYENNIFSQVEFIAPFDPDEGEIYAQIWKNDSLFYEQQVNDFTEGEWINVVYDDLFEIDVTAEYFIGYRIYSLSGNVAVAYHDAGPREAGKGAYVYTYSWQELSATHDYNFCINAVVVSQNSIGNNDNLIPLVTKLYQNYPNPFNPSTTISFSATENTESTELVIYNLKGQKIKDLSPSLCHAEPACPEPGRREGRGESRYSVVWNGTDQNNKPVSSGIYFYKLKTGNYEKTRKMILIK